MQAIELIDLARTTPATKRAVKVVIATGQRSKQVLLVQVLRDGSLVIDPAPKCSYRPWTYGYLTMPPGGIVDGSLQMFPESQTLETELPPKFTFHPSGIVTMGKTGRLYSIRNPMDLPLAEARGHIFTIMARGLDGFADEPRESAKYRYIGPSATEPLDTFRISGHIGPLGQWLNPPEMVARPHLLSGAVQPLIVQQPGIGSPAWIAMIRFVLRLLCDCSIEHGSALAMLVRYLTTHRYQCAGAGIRDRPSQGATLGKHLLQVTSSWTQTTSANKRVRWILLHTTESRVAVRRCVSGLCFGATWLCHYHRLPTTEADRDAIPRAYLDVVPNEGWTPVAPVEVPANSDFRGLDPRSAPPCEDVLELYGLIIGATAAEAPTTCETATAWRAR